MNGHIARDNGITGEEVWGSLSQGSEVVPVGIHRRASRLDLTPESIRLVHEAFSVCTQLRDDVTLKPDFINGVTIAVMRQEHWSNVVEDRGRQEIDPTADVCAHKRRRLRKCQPKEQDQE